MSSDSDSSVDYFSSDDDLYDYESDTHVSQRVDQQLSKFYHLMFPGRLYLLYFLTIF